MQERRAVRNFEVYFSAMSGLACLWVRSSLAPHADGELEGRSARSVAAHVQRCSACRATVDELTRLRRLVTAAAAGPAGPPDWSGFWAGIRNQIATQTAKPIREPWWLPWWKPVWGHPRLATSGVLAGALAVVFAFWPVANQLTGSSFPVVVQDVATGDPRDTVMVYSSKDSDVTVIWMFARDTSSNDD